MQKATGTGSVSVKGNVTGFSQKSIIGLASGALIFLFLMSSLILPSDNYHIKKITFVLLMAINVFTFLGIRDTYESRYILFYGVAYTVFIISLSILVRQGSVIGVIMRGYSGFLLLLYFIIVKYDLNYEKMLLISVGAMALIIFSAVALDVIRVLDLFNNPVIIWLSKTDNAMVSRGANTSFYYLIFLKCSPLIIILLLYSIYKRNLIIAVIALFAVIFSGTRANVFVAMGTLVLYLFFCEKNKPVKYMAILAIFAVLVLYGETLYDSVIRIFQNKASSDAVRSGHMESLLELFRSKPTALLWGTGLDSEIFSIGVGKNVTTLELSYWDILRQVGLVGFIPFAFFLLYPFFGLLDTDYRWLAFAYLGFLIISYTNPFLYGSTGYIIYLYVYLAVFKKAKPILAEIRGNSMIKEVKK